MPMSRLHTRGPSTNDAAGFFGYRAYSFFAYPRVAEESRVT